MVSIADSSGAFSIADTMGRVLDWVRTKRNELPAPLRARWSLGLSTPIGKSYKTGNEVFINGDPADPDEFDNSVVAHEVMHYVIAELSATDSRGGAHNGYGDPRFAWDEGLATLLGQAALGTPVYSDMTEQFMAGWNLETYNDPNNFVLGTVDGTQSGDMHEMLISMVLWDLMDDENEATDRFREESAVLGSVFDFLPAHRTRRRGAAGIDLVDFLDGFRCTLDPHDVTARDADLKVLLDDVFFRYDFEVAGVCG